MIDRTPLTTTNRLYNVGGSLYFNGVALATGSSVSGTTGYIPKFTGASTLGNSIIQDSSGYISIAGHLYQTTGYKHYFGASKSAAIWSDNTSLFIDTDLPFIVQTNTGKYDLDGVTEIVSKAIETFFAE